MMNHPMNFDGASCAGIAVDLFYPEDGQPEYVQHLRRVCAECPILAECFDWALHKEIYGFWAGTTKAERKRIRKDRNILEPNYLSEQYVDVRSIRARKSGFERSDDAA